MSTSLMTLGFRSLRRAKFVGFLTLACVALTLRVAAQPAATWQTPESIREAARSRVAVALGENAIVEAVAVDERLKLPDCGTPLATEIARPVQRGQGTVTVSCAGARPWRLFVPVRVTQQVAVLVARHDLAAGQVIGADDIEARAQSAATLPYEYLTDAGNVVGLTARRALPAGSVLASGALDRPELVARGAVVTLISGSGPVLGKSNGVALEPGRVRERVRVRSESGRIVEGVVETTGEVRVGS
jgi:flagella basal body P-ring formation protein FlgA